MFWGLKLSWGRFECTRHAVVVYERNSVIGVLFPARPVWSKTSSDVCAQGMRTFRQMVSVLLQRAELLRQVLGSFQQATRRSNVRVAVGVGHHDGAVSAFSTVPAEGAVAKETSEGSSRAFPGRM